MWERAHPRGSSWSSPYLCFPGSFGSRGSERPVLLPWTTLPMAWSGSTVWQGWEVKGLCWKSTDV